MFIKDKFLNLVYGQPYIRKEEIKKLVATWMEWKGTHVKQNKLEREKIIIDDLTHLWYMKKQKNGIDSIEVQ